LQPGREVANMSPGVFAVCPPRHFEHVDAGLSLQPQPLSHQSGAPFRRMDALTCGLPRRAHGVIDVVIEAGAVAVAMYGAGVAPPYPWVDLAVELAADVDFV